MQPEQLRKLVRKWTVPIVLLTLLGAAAGYYISHRLTPIYQAKGDVLVLAGPGQAANTGTLNLSAVQATTTAATLMTEPLLLQQVIKDLHLETTPAALSKAVTATPQSNSALVDVVVSDPSAARASQIANAVMNTYVSQVSNQNTQRINQAGAALQTQITDVQSALNQEEQQLVSDTKAHQDTTALRAAISANTVLLSQVNLNLSNIKETQAQELESVSVAAPAPEPTTPASPNNPVNTALGALIGLLVATGLAALFQYFDQALKTADDVRDRLAVPCLGVVPKFGHLAVAAESQGLGKRYAESVMEAYRRLRTNLLFSLPDADISSVVVTSVQPGEGKTRTAANLAVALANSEKRVLLIDADMRKPDQHRLFHKDLEGGLSELIVQARTHSLARLHAVQTTQFANLSLLTSGTIPPNPAELLDSQRARLLLRALAREQDVVVIDTAPVGAVTDPLSVAADASATILVVEAGKTNAAQAAAVIGALRDVGANVIGVVLNKAPRRSISRSYYGRYGYSSHPSGATSRREADTSFHPPSDNDESPPIVPAATGS